MKVVVSRSSNKQDYVSEFQKWNDSTTESFPTAIHLLGLFYLRYKQKYRLFPPSDVRDDLQNMRKFLAEFMVEDPTLAPYVIEYFFALPQFNGIQSATFCNRNILSKWAAFEQAEKIRSHAGVGEQSEFRAEPKRAYGVVRV